MAGGKPVSSRVEQKGGMHLSQSPRHRSGAALVKAALGSGRSANGNGPEPKDTAGRRLGRSPERKNNMLILWLWLLGATHLSLVPTQLGPGGNVEKTRSLAPSPTEPSENLKSERVQEAES